MQKKKHGGVYAQLLFVLFDVRKKYNISKIARVMITI